VLSAVVLSLALEYKMPWVNGWVFIAPRYVAIGAIATIRLLKGKKLVLWYVTFFALCGFLFYAESFLAKDYIWITKSLRYLAAGSLIGISIMHKKLSFWIFTGMLLGIDVGLDFPESADAMKKFGDIFLRLVKTLVGPLLFATLVVGIAGHGNIRQVGRIGLKSILYFEIVTTFALALGLLAINISQAGKGVNIEVSDEAKAKATELMAKADGKDHILDIFPESIARSMAENSVLQIVVFSVIFAIGLSMLKNMKHKETMLNWTESLSEVMFKFTDIVMYLAPLAVFGAIVSTVANSGMDVLLGLFKLVATLYITLLVFVAGVLYPIALLAKIPVKQFLAYCYEPVSIAFATASSESALPKALENMERFGVPKKIVGFVLPTGYSFNLDGTTLYLSMATVFIAQMAGVELTIGEQIGICLTLMLTSKGVAGVRGASFVILATTVGEFWKLAPHVEKTAIIFGVDALMDMARTSVNVLGNCLASAVIARSEKELVVTDKPYYDQPVDLS
jgi:proton glutamate symport protein